jgi:hypothetical protein
MMIDKDVAMIAQAAPHGIRITRAAMLNSLVVQSHLTGQRKVEVKRVSLMLVKKNYMAKRVLRLLTRVSALINQINQKEVIVN